MARTTIVSSLAALAAFFSFSALATDARVVSSEPVYSHTTHYRQVCTPVTETHRSVGGTLLGGVIGALAGNQIGGGSGRDIATAAGAVTGAAIGQNVSGDRQITRNHCSSQPYTVQDISHYQVIVDVNGSHYTVYRTFSPALGSFIPVTLSVN